MGKFSERFCELTNGKGLMSLKKNASIDNLGTVEGVLEPTRLGGIHTRYRVPAASKMKRFVEIISSEFTSIFLEIVS